MAKETESFNWQPLLIAAVSVLSTVLVAVIGWWALTIWGRVDDVEDSIDKLNTTVATMNTNLTQQINDLKTDLTKQLADVKDTLSDEISTIRIDVAVLKEISGRVDHQVGEIHTAIVQPSETPTPTRTATRTGTPTVEPTGTISPRVEPMIFVPPIIFPNTPVPTVEGESPP